jgi:hypothetical protein
MLCNSYTILYTHCTVLANETHARFPAVAGDEPPPVPALHYFVQRNRHSVHTTTLPNCISFPDHIFSAKHAKPCTSDTNTAAPLQNTTGSPSIPINTYAPQVLTISLPLRPVLHCCCTPIDGQTRAAVARSIRQHVHDTKLCKALGQHTCTCTCVLQPHEGLQVRVACRPNATSTRSWAPITYTDPGRLGVA